MSRVFIAHIIALTLLSGKVASSAEDCPSLFARLSSIRGIRHASNAVGMIVGGSNDLVITVMHGTSLIPAALGSWLPLTNEIANVAKTATGKRWIYSGISKQLADGVALGSILGHTLTATANHGALTGFLTFAANIGLTYWFPNKYFHKIMDNAYKIIPSSLPKIRRLTQSSIGQGFVGVSMIVIIEQLLQKAEHLAEQAPHMLTAKKNEENAEEKVRKAIAAFLLDDKIQSEDHSNSHDKILNFLFGTSREAGLFSFGEDYVNIPILSVKEKERIAKLRDADLKLLTLNLLSETEASEIQKRISLLLAN